MSQLRPLYTLILLCGGADVFVRACINVSVRLAVCVTVELTKVVSRVNRLLRDGDALLKNTTLVGLELDSCVEIEEQGAASAELLKHICLRHLAVTTSADVVSVLYACNDWAIGPPGTATGSNRALIRCA